MKPIETTVQRDYEHEGQAYGQGDRLPLPLVDALRLAKSGVVRLGYRQSLHTTEHAPRRRRRKTKDIEAEA
jgi:hypothetical protein